MIIINKSSYLKYKNFRFRCALGKAGIGKKKKEGDNITPKGLYKIVKIYYRKDRIKKVSSKFKLIKITKNIGWCDDPNSEKYNQIINLPTKYSYEKLYRKDNVYDLILVLNYNMDPVIKKKGSAIFIHVAKKNYQSTQGCIALKKNNLMKLISKINKNIKIKIN
jgi:L,D-peptidoglycan transpeptidase YkuD (ErfK/YbiS/YcfS/YnhG family)